MRITEMVEQAHAMAKEKGWWDDGDRNPLEIHALIHSEVSEATEEARKDAPPVYQVGDSPKGYYGPNHQRWTPTQKPEGELIELADVLIRIGDYCGRKGWDLEAAVKMKMAYNATRPHRHGGKKY